MRNRFRTPDAWAWYYHVVAVAPPLFGRASLTPLRASDQKLASEPHPMKTHRQTRKDSPPGNDKGRFLFPKPAKRSALSCSILIPRLSSMACIIPYLAGILL